MNNKQIMGGGNRVSEYILSSNGELMHYGIKGMKWGVRRYQNADGSLTPKGETRYAQVRSNDRLAKRQTKQAQKLLLKKKNELDVAADLNRGAANTAYKKSDKYVLKSEAKRAKGDEKGFEKYQSKAWKQYAKYIDAGAKADFLEKQSKTMLAKIDDIASGKLKAGRDFIVHNQYRVGALPIPGGLLVGVNKRSTLIERNVDQSSKKSFEKPSEALERKINKFVEEDMKYVRK